ncbi:MAG: hypothetical protein C0467_07190 [Planctomycetaceae bacterium]|nr:hypothetical protein [Planctomycetaceae bacterium]
MEARSFLARRRHMADISTLYPPTPASVPVDLTKPSANYRSRVLLVLACLLLFVGIYLCLTAGSAYACYACFAWLAEDEPRPTPLPAQQINPRTGYRTAPAQQVRQQRSEKPVVWLFIGGIASGLLFLFLVKGLFKRSQYDPGVRVEVTEIEQPTLFAFIRQLCKDTGAPFPHKVFLTPDVNAAVSFQESLLTLVFPTRKNLIIGLGLVNRLNLSEFKAVLAHEFGHFSQNSMALGSYVYTTNRVVGDIVYGRDWLDDLLAAAGRIDLRISVFVWTFAGGLWVLRKALEALFRGINFAHTSLSREMEYNADLVAASVTGSDALVFALARLDLAGDALGQAWSDLSVAADHKRYSRDLYFHQTKAAEYLKLRLNNPMLGEVPPLPDDPTQTVQVFKPEDTSVPKMWATHPSNHDREANVKSRYFRGPTDERSPWELFADPSKVRELVTRRVYEVAQKAKPEQLEDPEAVQEFIDTEHAETTYHPRYHGLYENRYVKPGDIAELCVRSSWEEFEDRSRLAEAHAQLYGDELKTRMEAHKARQEELTKLARVTHGAVELTGKDFEHRGQRYRLTDAPQLLKQVEGEVDADYEWMHALDRQAFRAHYAMAAHLGKEDRASLEEWYRFHTAAQNIHTVLVAQSREIGYTIAALTGQRQLEQAEFQNALGVFRTAARTLREVIVSAHSLRLPPLKNLPAGDPLGQFLLAEPLIRDLAADTQTLDGVWINDLSRQVGEAREKLTRILFKSLGGLLALQEQIAERWAAPVPVAEESTLATPKVPGDPQTDNGVANPE